MVMLGEKDLKKRKRRLLLQSRHHKAAFTVAQKVQALWEAWCVGRRVLVSIPLEELLSKTRKNLKS